MKPVLLNKRRYNWKDILRALSIIALHLIVYYAYTFFFIWMHDVQSGIDFHFTINTDTWWIIYPLTFGPIVSGITHIWYAESGKTNLRAVLWLHSLTLIIAVPIVTMVGM